MWIRGEGDGNPQDVDKKKTCFFFTPSLLREGEAQPLVLPHHVVVVVKGRAGQSVIGDTEPSWLLPLHHLPEDLLPMNYL